MYRWNPQCLFYALRGGVAGCKGYGLSQVDYLYLGH
nr:MAG TPA: hypothetical protein [Bacteriophage sp.]